MPVIIRRAPSTPKAGSSFVASTMGTAVGVADADEEVVTVGETVYVTLNTVGRTIMVGIFWFPERLVVVTVTDLVVRESDTFWDSSEVGVAEAEEFVD